MTLFDRLTDIIPPDPSSYVPFYIEGCQVGQVLPEFAALLTVPDETFILSGGTLTLHHRLTTPELKTAAVENVLKELNNKGHVPGWRHEHYRIAQSFNARPLMSFERAAAPLLGIRAYGVNVNGYVTSPNGEISLWVAKRSMDKPIGPGKLDVMVGGGQPADMSTQENLLKECAEEASLPSDISEQAVPIGVTVIKSHRDGEGLQNFLNFNYDLELSNDVIPQNSDGEVEFFELMPVEQVIDILSTTDDFLFDSALVYLDFLLRHDIINSGHDDYHALKEGMAPFLTFDETD